MGRAASRIEAILPLQSSPIWLNRVCFERRRPKKAVSLILYVHVNPMLDRQGSRAHKLSKRIRIYQALCQLRIPFSSLVNFSKGPLVHVHKTRHESHMPTPILAGVMLEHYIR